MLSHYFDIDVMEQEEIPVPITMSKIFQLVHTSIVSEELTGSVAVSFPEHDANVKHAMIGAKLRLFGSEISLGNLTRQNWLNRFSDYVSVSKIRNVPTVEAYQEIRRVQVQSGVDRMRRRLSKRHGITLAEASERIPDDKAKHVNLPYIQLESKSTGQRFRLFLAIKRGKTSSSLGSFNGYGISSQATVPFF